MTSGGPSRSWPGRGAPRSSRSRSPWGTRRSRRPRGTWAGGWTWRMRRVIGWGLGEGQQAHGGGIVHHLSHSPVRRMLLTRTTGFHWLRGEPGKPRNQRWRRRSEQLLPYLPKFRGASRTWGRAGRGRTKIGGAVSCRTRSHGPQSLGGRLSRPPTLPRSGRDARSPGPEAVWRAASPNC